MFDALAQALFAVSPAVRYVALARGQDVSLQERPGLGIMRRNVERQWGWLALSPRTKQIVVHTGHAVEEDDPDLVLDAVLDARMSR